jgi:tryptophanase
MLNIEGNMNIQKLEAILNESADEIPLVMLTITNNMIGGNPVSMENIRQTREICQRFNKPLFYDACRFAENAYLIKKREKGYENKSIKEICQEMFSLGDGSFFKHILIMHDYLDGDI